MQKPDEQIREILAKVDHTLLNQTATWNEVESVLLEAMEYHTASACIPPSYVRRAEKYVNGALPICTVIGFPNGYQTEKVKVYEADDAMQNGASELDMVINLGDLKSGNYKKIEQEIREIKKVCGHHILKVIIETCLLSEKEMITMCQVVTQTGADYIKTSTGFSNSGATFEDIVLFKKYVGSQVKMKAAGGIQSLEDAKRFIELGVSRLGTSKIIRLVKNLSEGSVNSI